MHTTFIGKIASIHIHIHILNPNPNPIYIYISLIHTNSHTPEIANFWERTERREKNEKKIGETEKSRKNKKLNDTHKNRIYFVVREIQNSNRMNGLRPTQCDMLNFFCCLLR